MSYVATAYCSLYTAYPQDDHIITRMPVIVVQAKAWRR